MLLTEEADLSITRHWLVVGSKRIIEVLLLNEMQLKFIWKIRTRNICKRSTLNFEVIKHLSLIRDVDNFWDDKVFNYDVCADKSVSEYKQEYHLIYNINQ